MIDSHAHLDMDAFDPDRKDVLALAKAAGMLREVASEVPLGRLLVETDCPYLAPVPHRGKRNEPAFVRQTAEVLAKVNGLSSREIEEATDENFHRFFKL